MHRRSCRLRGALDVGDAQFAFPRAPDGQVTALVLHQGGRTAPGEKIR